MKKSLIISIIFVLVSISAKAQYIYLSEDPTMFVEQADSLLKQWGNIGDSTSNNFASVWFDLNNEDQEKVIAISKTFRDRKYPVNPFFVVFYNALYNGVYGEFSEKVNLSEFLDVAQQLVENAEDPKDLLRYFITSRNLFEHGALYYHQYNVLSVPEGSKFTFEYVDAPSFIDPIIPPEVEEALNDDFDEDFGETEESDDEWSEDDWSDDSWEDDSWDDDSWEDDSWEENDESLANFDDDENLDNYGAFVDPFASPAPAADLPAIEGATIKIENADFEFFSPYDTFELQNVSGTYVFGSRNFVGDTGSMAIIIPLGEYESEAEITFSKFAFNTISPSISAENALLSFSDLFEEDIIGSFTVKSKAPEAAGRKYPVFRSYKSNYEYKNIGEGVKLIGGFTLLGDKINTQGLDLGKNYIEIERDNELVLKGSSPRFYVRDTLLKSHKVDLVIYQNRDSLTHPSMELNYDMSNSFLTLYWEKGTFHDRPMIDSYHNVDIKADKLSWDLNSQEINFGIINGRSDVPAIVRSLDNFDDQEYLRVKGINQFHPVQVAAYFSLKKRMEEFSFFELAEAYKIKPEIMKSAVKRAAGKGYLEFDEHTGLVKINSKTKHAYNSNFKKEDYDNMEWYSISPTGQNITLQLDSNALIIRGVDREIVSKALKVYYKPDSGEVVLKENRNFTFNGEIRAGNYSIKGKNFDFNYDDFTMNLSQIDSIRFNLSNDSTGESSERKIMGGEVENTGGMFYLNEPNNKSGRHDLPQYPILDVTKPSFVYFDDPDILGGSYDRKVYFEIPKFKIDTLASDNPSVINVKGTFHSGGIIPDFETELIVNKDLSLGFTHQLPEEGYPVFGNEAARYYNEVKMNTNGLNGNGTFNYLTSTTDAKNVIFYQDSMVVQDAVVDVKAGETEYGDYPDAKSADARAVLMASNERYIINSKGREMVDLYNGKAQLEGAAMISKKGMFGIGDVRTQGTDSRSRNFKFSKNSFTARDAEFFIEAYDQDTFALTAHDARLFFDFDKNTARLEPEKEGDAVISLPLMAYKTSIPVGTWDLDNQTFTMVKPDYVDIENSYFYSTLEDQDSLAFSGESAVYDAVASMLTVKGVPGVYVADAYITPGDSTIIIDESTLIQPLSNASIVMDAHEKYHYLNKADVDIYTRSKFDADANYVYVNSAKDTMNILFEGLFQIPAEVGKRKTDSVTFSESFIEEDANFYIAPKILYQGDVAVYANQPFLNFNGEIRLDLTHSDEFNDWLPFVYNGDPYDIQIELKDERELEEGEPMLTTGIHIDGGESQMYYTLLSSKRMDEDPDIFKVTGLLAIDAETGVFEVGSKEKLSGETNSGNLFSFNDSSSIVKFEGEFNLYGYMPIEISAKSYGKGRVNIDSGNYTFNTLTYLNFPIPGPALNAMGKDMSESTQYVDNLKEASESSYEVIYKLSQMIGEKAAENYNEQLYLEYIPLHAVSGKFNKSILFSDLDLKWHKEEGALYSGDTIGVSSIGKNDINGRIRGYYEIKKIYEDEIINLFIELMPGCWYYFSYDDGRLATYSSNHVYNEIIESKSKTPESGASQGEIYLASADLYEVSDYIKYYNETYLGRMLSDQDINLKVSKPEVEDKYVGGKEFNDGGSDDGWKEEPVEEDSGWGTEEEFDDGWGVPLEEDKDKSEPVESTETEQEEENIESVPFGGSEPEEEEEWGWGDEPQESEIIGAPPKEEKKKKEKRVKEKRSKKEPILVDEPKEEDSGWGFGDEPKEQDDGWGFGSEKEEEPVIVSDKKEKDKKEDKIVVEEEDDDSGWGFGGDEEESVEIKSKKDKAPEEKKIVVEDEDEDSGWGFGGEEEESVEIKAKNVKKTEEKKIVVDEEDDDSGWGFGGDDDSVEIVNDKEEEERKAKEEAERKAREEKERKEREEAERKAKEAADRKAKEEAEKKAQEEAEKKAKEEAQKKIVVEEEDDDLGWGFDDDESVEIVNDKKEEEAAAQRQKEAEALKAKEEEERKLKEEEERKAKEAEELRKKEEADKKAREEAERKAKEEADRKVREEQKEREAAEQKAREEEEKKKIVIEEEDDSGWGFGGDDESVEIVNDKKEKEEEEEKKKKEEEELKAKEEEERKKKEAEELKVKEEEEKKKKAEEERKKKEEEEKKKKEEEAKKKKEEADPFESDEEDDWDGF